MVGSAGGCCLFIPQPTSLPVTLASPATTSASAMEAGGSAAMEAGGSALRGRTLGIRDWCSLYGNMSQKCLDRDIRRHWGLRAFGFEGFRV